MNTVSTKIADFQTGDKFVFYSCIFEVTTDCKSWLGHNGVKDETPCYGRSCKFVEAIQQPAANIDGLLKGYNWMQGIDSVTYAKIVN